MGFTVFIMIRWFGDVTLEVGLSAPIYLVLGFGATRWESEPLVGA
jgi:hypothetical protein